MGALSAGGVPAGGDDGRAVVRSPLTLECYAHNAPLGTPCAGDGTCCPARTARAVLLAGVGGLFRAAEATRGEPVPVEFVARGPKGEA